MKTFNKISLRFSIFILTILFTGLSSCSKGKSVTSIEKQLIGTVWENNTDTDINQQLVTQSTLTFVSGTAFTLIEKDFIIGSTDTTSGTYVYDPPSITLTSSGESETGTITGNKMEFWSLGIFTKK